MTRRLLSAFLGLTLLVLLVHDIPLVAHLHDVERDRLTTSLERDAFTLAGLAEKGMEHVREGSTKDVPYLERLASNYATTARRDVAMFDSHAQLIARGTPTPQRSPALSASARLALSGVRNSGTRALDGQQMLFAAVPILNGPRSIGAVELLTPASQVDHRTYGRLRGLALAAAISLALAGAIGWVLARTLTQPLRTLRAATTRISGGDLKTRAAVPKGPTEIRALATDFNSMVDQVERVVGQQREFAGDVSHQLRTPLTTVQLRLEQLLAIVGDDHATREVLDAATSELRRLGRTIEALLAIARSDQTGAPIVDIDVGKVLRSRCESWEPLVNEASVSLLCDVAQPVVARSIAGALDEIIDNYIDNALDGAPNLSFIAVSAQVEGNVVQCMVTDDGPGMSDDELAKAFDRFWRGDRNEQHGHGVGLAVVHRLATACHGSVELQHAGRHQHSGIRAIVRLPLAP